MTLLAASSAGSSIALSWIILGAIAVSIVLALYCVFTIHRNPYFNELQKVGWLLLCLGLPIMGPVAWLVSAHHEKKVRSNPEKFGVQPVPSVSDFAAKLMPVYGDERSPATSHAPRSAPAQPARAASSSTTFGKTTRFAPNTEFASASDTSDTPQNPHLSEGEDGGPRVLRF